MVRNLLLIMLSTSPVLGDDVLLYGPIVSFVSPHAPYAPGFKLQITLGYGDPGNTLGQGLWISGLGNFDLSNDPNYANFLGYATNGVNELMTITLTDQDGFSRLYSSPETLTFGCFPNPDLQLFTFQSIHLNVIGLSAPNAYPTVQWNVINAPEPSGVLYALAMCFFCISRKRRAIRWESHSVSY